MLSTGFWEHVGDSIYGNNARSELLLEWWPWRVLFGKEWRGEEEGLRAVRGGKEMMSCVVNERRGHSKA